MVREGEWKNCIVCYDLKIAYDLFEFLSEYGFSLISVLIWAQDWGVLSHNVTACLQNKQ